jgi:uncharacterized protein (TIGR00369 family)
MLQRVRESAIGLPLFRGQDNSPSLFRISLLRARNYYQLMKELPHTRSCFVCGESNPIGLKLRFETDGRIVQTRFIARPEHVGFRQTVHGGLIATLLDEMMVWACAVSTKRFAFCAELNVRFQNPLRPGEHVLATAELVDNRRGKIFEAKGELRNETGQMLATAAGKYLPIKEEMVVEMAEDFVGDSGWVIGNR